MSLIDVHDTKFDNFLRYGSCRTCVNFTGEIVTLAETSESGWYEIGCMNCTTGEAGYMQGDPDDVEFCMNYERKP